MTVSMVAPKLSRLRPLGAPAERERRRRRRARLPRDARPAAAGHDQRRPAATRDLGLLRRLRGDGLRRTPRRARWPSASSPPPRRSGSRPSSPPATPAPRPARAASPRTSSRPPTRRPQVSWPASSPSVLAVGGTNLTLNADNTIASTGAWNDTAYPAPFTKTAGGGGGRARSTSARGGSPPSRSRARPSAWSPTSPPSPTRARATRSSAPAASRAAPARARASPSSAAPARRRRSSPA